MTTRRKFLKNIGKGTLALTAGTAISGFPAVIAKKSYHWKMVTTWPKNFPGLGTGANLFAKLIEDLSEKQLRIKVYGAKELVPAMGVFDAVKHGTAQMGHGASYYWKGKHEATQFFAAVPFGFTADEMNAWLFEEKALELWKKLYDSFGLIPFPVGNTGVQMGGWFRKKIRSLKDFKGLKMRMPGLGGEVLRRIGSVVVTLPGGEIFQALKTGAIDASEWVGPYNDLAFGFYQAAKYYYWPGWHEPGTTIECIIHKKSYQKLPKHLQKVIEVAAQVANSSMLNEFTARNAQALQTLIQVHKVQLLEFPSQVLKKIHQISQQVVSEIAKKDPFSKKVFQSFQVFQKKAISWSRVSEQGYRLAREL